MNLSEIVDQEIELKSILSKPLKHLLYKQNIELRVINDNEEDLLSEMNLLIEDTFPSKEAEHFKPSFVLDTEENPLCFVCLKNEEIIGGINVNFDFEDNSLTIVSVAVASESRNKKIGSLLMLVLHEIAIELGITSISLISSPAGKLFYKSFGFTEKAHDSFETLIPFEEKIIINKLYSFNASNNDIPEDLMRTKQKRTHQTLTDSSIFKPGNTLIKIEEESDEVQTDILAHLKRRRKI